MTKKMHGGNRSESPIFLHCNKRDSAIDSGDPCFLLCAPIIGTAGDSIAAGNGAGLPKTGG